MAKFEVERKHSLKKEIEECEKEKSIHNNYGEKILREFKQEINRVYNK